jgi:hypothetical protein
MGAAVRSLRLPPTWLGSERRDTWRSDNEHAARHAAHRGGAGHGQDEVARILAAARIADGPSLLDALEARRNELGLSNATVEELGGLTSGHLTKIAGPARSRSPTLATLDRLMVVLGLSFVLVRDPEKVERVQSRWRPRAASKVRHRALSATTIARAKPHVLAELARKASRPKWKETPAPMFLRALMQEDGP